MKSSTSSTDCSPSIKPHTEYLKSCSSTPYLLYNLKLTFHPDRSRQRAQQPGMARQRRTHTIGALAIATMAIAASCSSEKKETKAKEEPKPVEQSVAESEPQEESKTAFPTLNILPEGSILRRVKLPRYDQDFRPLSLLEADKLTVIDQNQIAAEGITVIMYEPNGQIRGQTEMQQAVYNQQSSTMVAKEAITMSGDDYTATGSGMVLNFKHGRGFLLGPATTVFQIKESDSQKKSDKKPSQSP
ncbi:MAG: hypothetical protein HKP20_04340 [Akkermansiaceae bacterium]|nr:hypothetical protein [Akkermansiaceae bacterium]